MKRVVSLTVHEAPPPILSQCCLLIRVHNVITSIIMYKAFLQNKHFLVTVVRFQTCDDRCLVFSSQWPPNLHTNTHLSSLFTLNSSSEQYTSNKTVSGLYCVIKKRLLTYITWYLWDVNNYLLSVCSNVFYETNVLCSDM